MKFGPVPLEEAEGKQLGHNIAGPDGKRAFRKGKQLEADDIRKLRELGRTQVYVAELEANDVDENSAARRVAEAMLGDGLYLSRTSTGRTNLYASGLGVLRVAAERLMRINHCEGVTVATLATHSVVAPRKMAATVKIIPFAVPEEIVKEAEEIAAEGGPLVYMDVLEPQKVGMIISGSATIQEKLTKSFDPLVERIETLGSSITESEYIVLDDMNGEEALAEEIARQRNAGVQMIVMVGETAIMDRYDIAPRAVERVGGQIESVGAPVDPGNLLMLAYLDGVAVLGAPGCARSSKTNIVDWILPRLLSREHMTRADIIALGHGGLLEDVPERPLPRATLK